MPNSTNVIAELKQRFESANLHILESKRPWPNRSATYFSVGKVGRQTDVVITDDFLRDFPNRREYQEAAESYASAVVGRLAVGSPQTFYCRSGVSINQKSRIERNQMEAELRVAQQALEHFQQALKLERELQQR